MPELDARPPSRRQREPALGPIATYSDEKLEKQEESGRYLGMLLAWQSALRSMRTTSNKDEVK
jgi:hypothetical protein